MENYTVELKEQIKWIDKLLAKNEKRLKASKGIERSMIRISKRKNGYQYYLQAHDGKRTYVKQRDIDKVKQIVQRDYDEDVKKKLLTLRYRLDRFLKLYDVDMIGKAYEELSDARKVFIDPIIVPDEEYIREWEEKYRGNCNPFPQTGQYMTDKGEYVRSKSEKILADMFYKYKIPYTYEPRFELENGCSLYPDFAVLNIRKRKTMYWEHFGLITDGKYATKTFEKLSAYEKSGLVIGKDILFSMESEEMPLDIKMLEKKIKSLML